MKKTTKLEKIIAKYGEPEKQVGNQYYWQCPYCKKNGRDNHRDNLQYNIQKDVLSCFADKSHTVQILQDLKIGKVQNNYVTPLQLDYKKLFMPEKQKEYKTYLNSPRKEEFLASRFALKEAYIKMKELSILAVDLRKIEVIKKESGAICISDGVDIYKASLSHEKDYCIGVCYD